MEETPFPPVTDATTLQRLIDDSPALALWFSGPDCGVCRDLQPKVAALLRDRFPRIRRAGIDCAAQPALAAAHQVFTIPALLVFFDGRETLRLARGFSLRQLEQGLARPYRLLFD